MTKRSAASIQIDLFYWGSLMAGALFAGAPVAVLFNLFFDDFVEGITGGAISNCPRGGHQRTDRFRNRA